jgi:hypothetical protein
MVMVTNKQHYVALVATLSVIALSVVPADADAFIGGPSSSFVAQRRALLDLDSSNNNVGLPVEVLRGGAATAAVEEDDDIEFESSDVDAEDEMETDDEDEEAVEVDPKLTKSATSAAYKTKAKAKAAAKTAVSATLQASAAKLKPKKKKSASLLRMFAIPYIIRACLNPFTLIKMTRGYFASLVNLKYLDEKVVSTYNLFYVRLDTYYWRVRFVL